MMPPSSWYRLEEFAQLESARRRAAARHRDHSSTRRRKRRRRPERWSVGPGRAVRCTAHGLGGDPRPV